MREEDKISDNVVIKITWLDSKGITPDWEHKEDVKSLKPSLITSVGYLLEDEEKYMTIVQSKSKEELLGRMTIPKCCITQTAILTAKQENK